MRNKPVLAIAVALTLVVELTLMVLVYNKIGPERLSSQFARLAIQGIFILLLFSPRFNWGLFLLTTYHVMSGLFTFDDYGSVSTVEIAFGVYHVLIGLVIYFHDWIEERFWKAEKSTPKE